MASLSRQLAQWVVGLRHQDLPAAVVDRAKGVTLHGLASVLLGSEAPGGRQAVNLITEEEAGVRDGEREDKSERGLGSAERPPAQIASADSLRASERS